MLRKEARYLRAPSLDALRGKQHNVYESHPSNGPNLGDRSTASTQPISFIASNLSGSPMSLTLISLPLKKLRYDIDDLFSAIFIGMRLDRP